MMATQFEKDVLEGLSQEPKTLPSRYFYDKKGDALFQQIMDLPEYYLTRAEMEIFTAQTQEIINSFGIDKRKKFELIELGAGDGSKTIKLLQALLEAGYDFQYIPIDISQNALDGLERKLATIFPSLQVKPMQGSYFDILAELKKRTNFKVVLFLGSNLGNLVDENAAKFMQELARSINVNDKILLGLDQIKKKEIVLPAYSDSEGVTREFNLNLLDRINRELNANFNRELFEHLASYNEETGIVKSFIVSNEDQEVAIKAINKVVVFKKNEMIQTEISRKYSEEIVSKIIDNTNLEILKIHRDSKDYFMDLVLTKQ